MGAGGFIARLFFAMKTCCETVVLISMVSFTERHKAGVLLTKYFFAKCDSAYGGSGFINMPLSFFTFTICNESEVLA
ncbi:hypothetical protein HMPREF1008_00895 [Olsenella sp. oral taxon 809 str. F0356]|nr:hypothetical protein HMPREF1008_00895 [Olsenella sp. oral taxon 809 str. F0356]